MCLQEVPYGELGDEGKGHCRASNFVLIYHNANCQIL